MQSVVHAARDVSLFGSRVLSSSSQMYTPAFASAARVNNEKFFSSSTKKQAQGLLGVEVRGAHWQWLLRCWCNRYGWVTCWAMGRVMTTGAIKALAWACFV